MQGYEVDTRKLQLNEKSQTMIFENEASSILTQAYAELNIRTGLITLMIRETSSMWSRFLKTADRWMGNILPEDQPQFDFFGSNEVKLKALENRMIITQQHRSQALTENTKRELMPSTYSDEKRHAIYVMIKNINEVSKNSQEFIDMLGDKMVQIHEADEKNDRDIWKLTKIKKSGEEETESELSQ